MGTCQQWIQFVDAQTHGAGYRTNEEYTRLLAKFNKPQRQPSLCERWIEFVKTQTGGASYLLSGEYNRLLARFNALHRN